jgi:hypothetical protein
MAGVLREWDRCRWVWNQAVARLNESGEWVRDDALTSWRQEHDWLRDGSVVAQQQMLRNFRTKRAKGKGRRKFKSGKRSLPSLNYTKRGFAVRNGRLCLAGGLSIPVVWSRELPSEPSSVRVYRDSIGHWYASFVVRHNDRTLPVATGHRYRLGRAHRGDYHGPGIRPGASGVRQACQHRAGTSAADHGAAQTRPRRTGVPELPRRETRSRQAVEESRPAAARHRAEVGHQSRRQPRGIGG